MTRARERIQIRVSRVVEHETFGQERAKSAVPMAIERLQVVGTHLVDDQHHDELRCALRLNAGDDRQQSECECES